jgi:hypothetical protein
MADDDTIDDIDDTAADYSVPDPILIALELCRIASSPKTTATAIKRLRRLGRDIDAAEQKLAAVTAAAEQTKAVLDGRAAELDARAAALDVRQTDFETSLSCALQRNCAGASPARASSDGLGRHSEQLEPGFAIAADLGAIAAADC